MSRETSSCVDIDQQNCQKQGEHTQLTRSIGDTGSQMIVDTLMRERDKDLPVPRVYYKSVNEAVEFQRAGEGGGTRARCVALGFLGAYVVSDRAGLLYPYTTNEPISKGEDQ